MNHTHEQGGAGAPQGANENALSATLKTRHLTMMSIAGVIGGSLFVGSGSIVHSGGAGGGAGLSGRRHRGGVHHAHAGRDGHRQSRHRLVLHLCRLGHRPLGGLHHRLAVLGLLGAADGLGGARRGHHPARVVPDAVGQRVHAGRHAGADPAELLQRQELRRGRVLVRADQGRGHRLLHRRRHAGRAAAVALGEAQGVANLVAHGGSCPTAARRWWWRCWG